MQNPINKLTQFPKSYTYRPLPKGLYIDKSDIEGQGLFASAKILENEILGTSHIKLEDELFRLPLGGFINHADNPNCKLKTIEESKTNFQKFYLISIQDINPNQELTIDYNVSAILTKILWSNKI
jgi:SET domain-containing protein